MKKSFLSFVIFVVSILSVFAQAPQAFKYQAIARDGSGNLIAEKELGIRISLLQGSESGEIAFSETHHIKSNEFGLVNVLIGQGQAEKGNFMEVDWGANSYWVKVEMDIAGGDNYKLMGSTALYSVPYALYAKQAETLRPFGSESSSAGMNRQLSKPSTMSNRSTPNSKISSSGDSWLNATTGNVGIGTSTPTEKLYVQGGNVLIFNNESNNLDASLEVYNDNSGCDAITTGGTYSIFSSVCSDGEEVKYGIKSIASGNDGTKYAIYGFARSDDYTDNDPKIGVYGRAYGEYGYKYGLKAYASGPDGRKYGVYAEADGSEGYKYGVYGLASDGEDNNYGVYGEASDGEDYNYGVYGEASGTYGTKYGVFGEATGTGTNWAGYFQGRLYADQNVGFGTTDPNEHLEVSGGGNQIVRITSTNHQHVAIEFIRTGSTYKDWKIVDSVGHLYFLYSGDDFATNPDKGYKMHSTNPESSGFMPVEDGVKDLGGSSNRWRYLYLTEGVIIPANPGDIINIRDIDYGLDEILQLNPISYSLKDHPEAEPKLGLQALETGQIISEAVTKDPVFEVIDEGNVNYTGETDYGINYSTLIPVLIKGMQEQQAIIDELKEDNADLLKRIDRLEKAILEN